MALAYGQFQVIVPPSYPPAHVPVATHLRGTLLANSLALVREAQREHEYFAHLPARHHADIRAVVALGWVPMDLSVAHYQTMDALFRTPLEQLENGRIASERTQNAWVRTVARTVQATGSLDLPSALKRLPFALERMVRGGAGAVYRTAPKDLRIELTGFPFIAIPYARNAWQGMFESALALLARRVFLRQDARFSHPEGGLALQVSWV
jgi:hypothetical protein